MNYSYKQLFFKETPEDNFKAKIISMEELIFPNFLTLQLFELQAFQTEGGQ
jgi:hypothetical protein